MIKLKLSNQAQGVWFLPSLFKCLLTKRRIFYRMFVLSGLVLFSFLANATIYYVSTSGNDSNAGTSESLPWKSLTKVNSFTPKAGDQILFKRGEEWSGTITVKASGTSSSRIIYGAYGTGNKPKIYGSEKITGWTQHSGNIYKASFKTDITQLFVNGVKMKVARLTNTGYNIISSVSSQTQITCNTLNAGFNYAGAKILLRTQNYYSIMKTISSSSSKTLYLNSAPDGIVKVNQGFLLMNKLEFLDSPGEWYYDSATDMVYVWVPGGDSPANYEVRGTTLNDGIVVGSRSYITVNNLNILQQRESGLNIWGGNVTIENNLIEGQEGYGIFVESSYQSVVVQNNIVDAVNGIGIYMWIVNSIVRDNTVTNTGEFNMLGLNGTWTDNGGSGMEISGDGNIIEYNRIIGTNYNGIFWRGKTILQYNLIKNTCLNKSDGGGIYTGGTSASGSTVRYNIIDNVVGNQEGGITGRNLGEGIYLDEPSLNITCENNTVVRSSNSGIFLHDVENHTLRNNTIMDARYGIFVAKASGTVKSNISGNTIALNSATDDYEPRQLAVRYASGNATFDNNTYVCPFSSELVFRASDGYYKNFTDWKASVKSDANATCIGTALKTGETQQMFYNDTKQSKTFNLGNSTYRDIYGKQVTLSFTLEPFTSKILIKTTEESSKDITSPAISSFSVSAFSSSLSVPVNIFTAADNIAVTGYMITESSQAPNAGNTGWSAIAPTTYNFTSEGTKTLYAWTKDAAGNVSSSLSKQVLVTLNAYTGGTLGNLEVFNLTTTDANRRAMPVTFGAAGEISSISIYHNGGTGNVLLGVYSDQSGLPASQLRVTPTTIVNPNEGWQTVALTSPVKVSAGQTVWLAWVFQTNPGIRWTYGTPGRASSSETWSAGMPASFGSSTVAGYKYSIYCSYSPVSILQGNTEVYSITTYDANRRAMPVTFSEAGEIGSISIYHNGGTGNVLLGVYSDQSGLPASQLGVTTSTIVNSTEGWQTVALKSPVTVFAGQTIWLAWVFQNNPGIRWTYGTPGRASSPETWSAGMPASFGSSTVAGYIYSIYCTYRTVATTLALKSEIIPDEAATRNLAEAEEQVNTQLTNSTDLLNKLKIDMYPNPAGNIVTIRFSEIPVVETRISIFDMTGREVQSRIVQDTHETFDLQELKQGIYLVKTEMSNNFRTQKLIKK